MLTSSYLIILFYILFGVIGFYFVVHRIFLSSLVSKDASPPPPLLTSRWSCSYRIGNGEETVYVWWGLINILCGLAIIQFLHETNRLIWNFRFMHRNVSNVLDSEAETINTFLYNTDISSFSATELTTVSGPPLISIGRMMKKYMENIWKFIVQMLKYVTWFTFILNEVVVPTVQTIQSHHKIMQNIGHRNHRAVTSTASYMILNKQRETCLERNNL